MPRELRECTLTLDAFHAFLTWLAPQKIEDGEAYEKARNRLIIFFASRKCREPESLADKTIDIAILKMAEIPAEAKPIAYLLGIAKNVFRAYLRDLEKEQTANANSLRYQGQSQFEVEHNHTCLDRCLNELQEDDRTVLIEYYSQSKRAKIELRRQLAKQRKLEPNALRNHVFRLNQRMARCVNNCLENLPA
jgi:DNA-directed RNA polymerase specialized sigma24 family protein